jgi:GNAT superfamily N-acetyltransferase
MPDPVTQQWKFCHAAMEDAPILHALIAESVRVLSRTDYSDAQIVGCGGWSPRRTLCCGDNRPGRDACLLNPAQDAAKIRAIFMHPSFARRGLGRTILQFVERLAAQAGFRSLEMGATVTGAPLYAQEGYRKVKRMTIALHVLTGLSLSGQVQGLAPGV